MIHSNKKSFLMFVASLDHVLSEVSEKTDLQTHTDMFSFFNRIDFLFIVMSKNKTISKKFIN